MADEEMHGWVSVDEAQRLFSFLDLDRNAHEREQAIAAIDTQGTGRIVRLAFVELCVALLWSQPLDEIESAMGNFKNAQVPSGLGS